ncbi:quinone oxidoreductase family protein [Sphingomonas sp. 1P08PE]|uniref:quinone oxidoreductase family protein n=1 Tax=Sphingomonas sp. 1P08PE TaxID=554122 RepID=UPI0039A2FB4E
MNAVYIDRFGGAEVLTYGPQPVPQAQPGQVLVKMAYAGVGTWDPLIREGVFADITGEVPAFPIILGTDGSGIIAAIGEGIDRFAIGDAVYVLGSNVYAEYAAIDADAVSKVPSFLPLDQAAAMPVIALTSHHGLVDELRVKKGDSLLINGASGDAGHVAIQLAKLIGVRVLAVASGEDGVRAALELGADSAVDGKVADVAAAARAFAPGGLDAVLTFVAGPGLDAATSAVREGGRVAYPLGVEPEPRSRAGVHFHHFDLTLDAPATTRTKMTRLNALISSGPFQVRVARSVPLAHAGEAHELLRQHRVGKILLDMGAA